MKNTLKLLNIGLTTILLCSSSFAQESAFVPKHDSEKCMKDITHLIHSQKIGQRTVHNLLTELTSSFSNKDGNSTSLCNQPKLNKSNIVQKFEEYFYSNRGISFDEFKKTYSVGFNRLLALKKKRDKKQITKKQACEEVYKDDYITLSILLDESADWASMTCENLQKVGFSCGRSIPKKDYYTVLQNVERSIHHLSTLDPLSFSEKEDDEFMKIGLFFGGSISEIETRIADLAPEKSDKLTITPMHLDNGESIKIHMSYAKDKSFPTDKNWETFSKKFKQAIESFWKGSYLDKTGKHQGFIVNADEINTDETRIESSNVWMIGDLPEEKYGNLGNALGATIRSEGYLGFHPEKAMDDSGSPTWQHEFGHVLGFGEAYGAWLESRDNGCYIGLFNDVTNVMNNTTQASGKLIPILNSEQIKSVFETYANDSDSIDQKIYQTRNNIIKIYDELAQKIRDASDLKEKIEN